MSILDIFRTDPKEKQLVTIIEAMFDDQQDISRTILETVWWRNILYYCGEQHFDWIKSTKSFRKRLSPEMISQPVSNEIREYVRSVKAMYLNQKLVPRVVPNSEERADKDAAAIGKDLLSWMDTLNDSEIEDEKEKVAIWVACAGTAFMRTLIDKDLGEWFMGKGGKVTKTGDVVAYNVVPFAVRLDTLGDKLRDKRWVAVQSLVSKEWVEDTFGVKIVKADSTSSLDYQKRLLKLVTQVSPWKGYGMESNTWDLEMEEMVVFREVEFKPYANYPDGRYVVVCGGQLLVNVDRMPIKAEKGRWYYSLTDFHFNYVPGRFWSDSGVDDLISPQNSINEIDRSFENNRRTLGRPLVIVPGEISLQRKSERGDHVLVMSYDARAAAGAKPVISPGIPLPNQFLEERSVHKQQIQEMGGDPKNVLKGQAPSAHASGKMTETLRETALQGHAPDVNRFNRSMERVYRKRLLLAKEAYTEQRVIKIVGKGNDVKIRKFRASDLRNNTDVRLEIDSGLATTHAEQREVLVAMIEKGLFGDLMQQPDVRQELIQKFGYNGFADRTSVDYQRAERENSAIEGGEFDGVFTTTMPVGEDAEVVTPDPLFNFDNHIVHYESHRKQMLVPEFQDWGTEKQTVLVIHTSCHQFSIQLEQRKQVEQMVAMAQAQQPQQPQQQSPQSSGTVVQGGENAL
jgi:hypothetical protein